MQSECKLNQSIKPPVTLAFSVHARRCWKHCRSKRTHCYTRRMVHGLLNGNWDCGIKFAVYRADKNVSCYKNENKYATIYETSKKDIEHRGRKRFALWFDRVPWLRFGKTENWTQLDCLQLIELFNSFGEEFWLNSFWDGQMMSDQGSACGMWRQKHGMEKKCLQGVRDKTFVGFNGGHLPSRFVFQRRWRGDYSEKWTTLRLPRPGRGRRRKQKEQFLQWYVGKQTHHNTPFFSFALKLKLLELKH